MDELKEILSHILGDSKNPDENLRALVKAFFDNVPMPIDGYIAGTPISVREIKYDGNERRGIYAKCVRKDGSEHDISLVDLLFSPGSNAALYANLNRLWAGLDAVTDRENTIPHNRHKVSPTDIVCGNETDLVVLTTDTGSAYCKLLGTDRVVTVRSSAIWDAAPGEIITIIPKKIWTYAGHPYLSGDFIRARLNIEELKLIPLSVNETGEWDPAEYYQDDEEQSSVLRDSILKRGKVPEYEIEQIIPGEDPADPDSDPILLASEMNSSGDHKGAWKSLMDICKTDLRCLDAHAHLGNINYDNRPKRAMRHYAVGTAIGDLFLGDGFSGILPWYNIDNRPFLRCLHGFGLCQWRIGKYEDAYKTLERLLLLNPMDNQGVRFIIEKVRKEQPWTPDQ